MFDLFTKYYKLPPSRDFTIKKYSRMDYVKRMMVSEIARLKKYYRNRERGVNNSHMLNRLISMCSSNIELSDMAYRATIKASYLYTVKQLEIVSNINDGFYHENLFFSKNAIEVLYAVENDVDWFTLEKTWRDAIPIRCVYHELTDINYYPMFGTMELQDQALFVYEIDIILLMAQYRYWSLERIENNMSTNPTRFLAMYVMPNMIGSMTDLAILNRLFKINKQEEIPKFRFEHPIQVMDFTRDIDRLLNSINYDTSGEDLYLEQLFLTIPAIEQENMDGVLRLHKQFFTRQSEWILWVSRIRYIYDLMLYIGKKGEVKNKDELYYLPAMIRRLENRSTTVRLPGVQLAKLDSYTFKIKEIIGKR